MSLHSRSLRAGAEFAQVLHHHGLRATPQRRTICQVFAGAEDAHLSADDVFRRARRRLPGLSRATVYNALGELTEAGLLALVEGRGPTRYDANVAPHHHFRCRRCNMLYDVQPGGVDDLELSERGFRIETAHVLLEGLCPSCAARG